MVQLMSKSLLLAWKASHWSWSMTERSQQLPITPVEKTHGPPNVSVCQHHHHLSILEQFFCQKRKQIPSFDKAKATHTDRGESSQVNLCTLKANPANPFPSFTQSSSFSSFLQISLSTLSNTLPPPLLRGTPPVTIYQHMHVLPSISSLSLIWCVISHNSEQRRGRTAWACPHSGRRNPNSM